MAAAGGVSQHTLVNSIFPRFEHCLHREGPVVISATKTIGAGCREYKEEKRPSSATLAGGMLGT